MSPQNLAEVRALMIEFADRTGLTAAARAPRRYLWTDAFAVCVFLELFEATGDQEYRALASTLIEQVHATLGRHRPDDPRSGWISGLDEAAGRRHPTAGGLRIGKPLNERAAGAPADEREEWDRDGQYFHYLTRWMQALARAAVVLSDATHCRHGLELAQAAHAAFGYRATHAGPRRMYWKMSIDLSRPLVSSMGHHDPLDAFVCYNELEHCRNAFFADAGLPGLRAEIDEAAAMCAGRSWVTDDPLGLGGLLIDAYRLSRLPIPDSGILALSLGQLLVDARTGLAGFVGGYALHAPAEHRLAFRELGLAIGLHAVDALRHDGRASLPPAAERGLQDCARFLALAGEIETFWRDPANRSAATWRDHRDINSVMLAASLMPRRFLRL